MATFEGERGSATESFVRNGAELVHGNQILAGKVLGYHPEGAFRNSDHTLTNIWQAIDSVFATQEDTEKAKLQFAEYLVLDALIGNTDKHHENWGVLRERTDDGWRDTLAPSFDHASSLGRELLDVGPKKSRQRLLDEQRVGAYAEGGHGGIFWSERDKKAPSPLELVRLACAREPAPFQRALHSMNVLDTFLIGAVVDRVPENWMSSLARKFSLALMYYSADELRKLIR